MPFLYVTITYGTNSFGKGLKTYLKNVKNSEQPLHHFFICHVVGNQKKISKNPS